MRSLCKILILSFIAFKANAQYVQPMGYKDYSFWGQINVGNNGAKVTNPSAYLEIGKRSGSTKGVLFPRGNKDSVQSPYVGLIIDDVPSNKLKRWNGSAWEDLGVDTIPLHNQIIQKLDSVQVTSDSIRFFKNGVQILSIARVDPAKVILNQYDSNQVAKAWIDSLKSASVQINKLKSVTTKDSTFEIDIIPDIQFMTDTVSTDYNAAGRSIFEWIANHKTSENIKAVLQVGDITNYGTTREWDTATAFFNILDTANVTYMTAMGNHDWNPDNTWGVPREADSFNVRFGLSRYGGKSYYAGYFSDDPENQGLANSYYKFDIGSKKYFVLQLEFLPRDTVVSWAGKLLDSLYAADPSRQVMVLTHAYITAYGELAQDSSQYTGDNNLANYNSGQSLWDKLIKKKPNIRWVFSGHYIYSSWSKTGFNSRITSVGESGNTIEQIFTNYQSDSAHGSGYFVRLKFDPKQDTVGVSFYSDYKKTYDPAFSSYAINDPPIDVNGDFGVAGNVAVNKNIRVAGKVNLESLTKYRIPFIGDDHRLQDDSGFSYKPNDKFYVKIKTQFDSSLTVKKNIYTDTIAAPTGVFNIKSSRLQIHKGSQFATTNNVVSIWRNDTATTTSPTLQKTIEVNSYTTYLNNTTSPNHPAVVLSRGYDMPDAAISYSTTYQASVFGLFMANGFDTKPGISSSTITAGTTPLTGLSLNMYKFVNQGSGTRTINGFVGNAKYVLDAPVAGSITSYADVIAGLTSSLGSTLTNRYGIYINDLSGANVTNAWGFYQDGINTKNHFDGALSVGDTTTITTMGDSDSSNRAASTAWVKRQGYVNKNYDDSARNKARDSVVALIPKTLSSQYTDASNTLTTEQDLLSYTLPASSLLNVGDRIMIEAIFTTPSGNSDSKDLKFYFGSAPYEWAPSTIATGATIFMRITIVKTGSNAQRLQIERTTGYSDYPVYAAATQTDTSTIVLKFAATCAAASDITQRTMFVTYYPAP